MNLDQLGESFGQNRTAILGAAAAGVVGFALYKRKQAGGSAPAAAAGPATAGAYSAGGQTAGMYGANAYDSSASDVYGLVQPQLESLGHQVADLNTKLGSVPISAATSPIASSLSAPTRSGTYLQFGNGNVEELESDNSLYHLSLPEWGQIQAGGGTLTNIGLQAPTGPEYSNTANLQTRVTNGGNTAKPAS